MNTSAASASLSRRFIKWLLWLLFTIIILIFLISASVYFLPVLISTEWFTLHLENQASRVLGRSVKIDRLHWSWAQGIRVEGLQLDDSPDFSSGPIFRLEGLHFATDIGQLFKKRLIIDLELKGLNLRLIRNPDNKTNLDFLLSKRKSRDKPATEITEESTVKYFIPIPLDIKGSIRLTDSTVKMLDRLRGKRFSAHDISLAMEADSLRQKAVDIKLSMKEILDDEALPPVRMAFSLENLIRSGNVLSPDKAVVMVEGDLPGLHVRLRGDAGKRDLSGDARLDLAVLGAAVQPFVTPVLPDVSGEIKLDVAMWEKSSNEVAFAAKVTGAGLSVSGEPLNVDKIGPINLASANEGTLDISNSILEVKKGELRIQNKSLINWKGSADLVKEGGPFIDLIMGPVSLELDELYELAGKFIPAGLSIYNEGKTGLLTDREGSGNDAFPGLQARSLKVRGPILSGHIRTGFEGISIFLPSVRMRSSSGTLSTDAVNIEVKRGECLIESGLPSRLDLSAGISARGIHVMRGEEIRIERLELPSLNITATDIKAMPDGMFGIGASINLEESIKMKGMSALPSIHVPDLDQSLKARINIEGGNSLTLDMESLSLTAPSVIIREMTGSPLKTSMDLDVEATILHLKGIKPLRADLEKSRTRLSVGKLFRAEIDARALDLGSERLVARGRIVLDLENLLPLLPSVFISGADMAGEIDLGVEFKGRLPRKEEIAPLTGEGLTITQKLRKIGFIESLDLAASLNNLGGKFALGQKQLIKVARIDTKKPVRLSLEDGMKKGEIEGEIVFGSIEELPAL